MTFGDVIALVALLAGSGLAVWAAILCAGLLFTERTRRAAEALQARPAHQLGIGAGATLATLLVVAGMVATKNGAFMIIGWAASFLAMLVACIGAAGLARIAATRICNDDRERYTFAAYGRAAALLVGAAYIPGFGWLFLMPLQCIVCLGAGISALRRAPQAERMAAPAAVAAGGDAYHL